jgi:sialic acid synthase SpsE|tara:strand:+ start:2260 stop:2409 length:150 start_codon:yes stop_codon:yes gene_type:complete
MVYIISTGMATLAEVFDALETIRVAGNNDIIVLQFYQSILNKVQIINYY